MRPLKACDFCGRVSLVRPGMCYECKRVFGIADEPAMPHTVWHPPTPETDPERAARIREYERRAAAKLPLFASGRER
jgi:hypothetical protein